MNKSAHFSEDRSKRFDLVRDWRDEIGAPNRTVLFGCLNPSDAGEEKDDPTVRKMVGFGRRWGFGRMVVVNLDPHVTSDPWELPYWSGVDYMNRAVINRWFAEADMVVAAWGSQPRAVQRNIAMGELVLDFCGFAKSRLYCIGVTKGGEPLHPSRTAYTLTPVVWREAGEK